MSNSFPINRLLNHKKELMGLAIILIILFHYGTIYIYYDVDNTIALVLRKIVGAVGVEVFLLLSGIGIYSSLKKNSTVDYFKHRAIRLIPSYIIIGGIFYIYKDCLIEKHGLLKAIFDISTISFWFGSDSRFWYISLIIVLYLISPLIYHIMDKTAKKM